MHNCSQIWLYNYLFIHVIQQHNKTVASNMTDKLPLDTKAKCISIFFHDLITTLLNCMSIKWAEKQTLS